MLKDYLEESIIIFDEAHNIESVAEEGNSVEFTGGDLDKTVEDFGKLFSLIDRNSDSLDAKSKNDARYDDIARTINNLK